MTRVCAIGRGTMGNSFPGHAETPQHGEKPLTLLKHFQGAYRFI
jgi:hypothetical protein